MRWARRYLPPSGVSLVVILATIAAVIAVCAVVWAVVLANQVADLSERQREGRRAAIQTICLVDTEQNRALRALILDGVKGSRVFEDIYREYGAPSYPERLKQARKAASTLPDVDCARLQERAKTE